MPINVLNEIVSWAATLPPWQSDALRRLLLQGELSAEDTSEILKMLEAAQGHTETTANAPMPQPLVKGHLPALMDDRRKIILRGMHSLHNVNAIASEPGLKFIDKGVTVIYGDNAAGKSGYSRVLKRACRARDKAEAILPNLLGTTKPMGPATAVFELLVQDKAATVTWTDGAIPPEELGRLIVFDSKCATFYVDKANQVIYVPHGLDVFPKMAALMTDLHNHLQTEINAIPLPPKILTEFSPNTVAGELVAQLSHTTSADQIEKYAAFAPEDQERLAWLRSTLAGLKASDPKAKAVGLRRLKRRVEKLATTLGALEAALSEEALAKLQSVEAEAENARQAAKLASQVSFAGEPLVGVGGPVWRELFEAARRYSEAAGYPGEKFPFTDGAARCVLCQQELDIAAKDRLHRFDQFIRDDTAQQATVRAAALSTARKSLEQLDTDPFAADAELLPEIASAAADLAPHLEAYITGVQLRTAAALRACTERDWPAVPAMPPSPADGLTKLAELLEREAVKVDRAAEPEEQQKLEAEVAELEGREKLAGHKEEISVHVSNLKRQSLLQACIAATNTKHISLKASHLAKEAITGVLEQALGEELQNLGVGHVPLQLKKTGELGNTLHQLHLVNTVAAKATLSAVLSEGEQRVVAIAAFLAEIRASGTVCGIVFDDPVCSLDHNYRLRVAARLVSAGREKQVIIFTHDIVFLLALRDQATKQQIPFETQTVKRFGTTAGVCEADLPWPAMEVKGRLGHLSQVAQKAASHHAKGEQDVYEALASNGYGLLRETWERAVEERLLNDSVQRFRPSVETQRLRRVVVEDGDWIRIEQAMSKCSEWMTGHDKAAGKGTPFPSPVEFKADVAELESFLKELEARQSKAEKARKILQKPPGVLVGA